MNKFILCTATLIGTIVGAGIFGIPYAIYKSGFFPGVIMLMLLGGVFILVMMLYSEVVLSTQGNHRFIGYIGKYIGKKTKILASISIISSFYATIIAYLIIGGKFLSLLLKQYFGGNLSVYTLVFFIISAIIIFRGVKLVSSGELIMTIFLILVVLLLLYQGIPHININNFINQDISDLFLPYGVILFALSGLAAIPELPSILKEEKRKLKKVIIAGTIIPVIIYLLFSIMVIGVCGQNTSTDALSGLSQKLPQSIIHIEALFGLLAVLTSLLIFGLNSTHIYQYDYNLPHNLAFVLAIIPPIILFFLGIQNFIVLIGTIGAIFGSSNIILVILMHRRVRALKNRNPEYSISLPPYLSYFLILIFTLGIIWQINTLIR